MSDALLGTIAVATLVIAVAQVVVMVAVARLARRLGTVADDLDREVRPLLGELQAISRDAARVSRFAVAQAERADRLLADLSAQVSDTVSLVQRLLVTPAREGRAVVAAVMAVAAAFREIRSTRPPDRAPARVDDEDPLFIG